MKISLADLDKSIKWLHVNSNEFNVTIREVNNHLEIISFDRDNKELVIQLSVEGTIMPVVKRTERI